MNEVPYVHGYSAREANRPADQANILSELLHRDTVYPPGSLVLECGCGTGAQTVILAARNPGARIVAVDISAASREQALRGSPWPASAMSNSRRRTQPRDRPSGLRAMAFLAL